MPSGAQPAEGEAAPAGRGQAVWAGPLRGPAAPGRRADARREDPPARRLRGRHGLPHLALWSRHAGTRAGCIMPYSSPCRSTAGMALVAPPAGEARRAVCGGAVWGQLTRGPRIPPPLTLAPHVPAARRRQRRLWQRRLWQRIRAAVAAWPCPERAGCAADRLRALERCGGRGPQGCVRRGGRAQILAAQAACQRGRRVGQVWSPRPGFLSGRPQMQRAAHCAVVAADPAPS